MTRKLAWVAALLAVPAALAVALPGSAQAATATARTSPTSYGNATLNTATGLLTVNDTNTDSRRVIAWVWNESLGGLTIGFGEDANGNNGTPGHANVSGYLAGDTLSMQVCRRNGAGGADTNCGPVVFVRA